MLKRPLAAALLVLAAGSAAQAGPRANFGGGLLPPNAGNTALIAPVYLGPYGRLAGARGILCSPLDERPMDALLCQRSNEEEPGQRFFIAPFFQHDDDADWFGVGLAYANLSNIQHPWNVAFDYAHASFEDFADTDVMSFTGKYVLMMPRNQSSPVVALVGRYGHYSNYGERWDATVAADQRITDTIYGTVNLGWARANFAGNSVDDFVAGIGATYVYRPNFTFSIDYLLDNDVDREDHWSITGTYAIDATQAVRAGVGDNGTIFANYLYKIDRR